MEELILNTEVELTPGQAREYCKKKWVLIWKDNQKSSRNHEHNGGNPELRTYQVVGKW